jgi:hypothetical protein
MMFPFRSGFYNCITYVKNVQFFPNFSISIRLSYVQSATFLKKFATALSIFVSCFCLCYNPNFGSVWSIGTAIIL